MREPSKTRLRATYQHQKQLARPLRAQQVRLRGSDAKTNVALYPTALQVDLGHEQRFIQAPCSTPTLGVAGEKRDADITVRGAIDVLNALVDGLDEEWLNAPGVAEPTEAPSAPQMVFSCTQDNLDSHAGPESLCEPSTAVAPHWTRPLPNLPTPAPSRVPLRLKETFETSEHNKKRLRATLARTKSIYAPGSCVRPSGQLPGSETPTMLHGSDGALNVALYPKAMLLKLTTFEGDDMADSTICDAEDVVCGAIERLNALVNGMGYDWVNEGVTTTHCMKRGGSMGSNSTVSSVSEPITPRDQVVFSEVLKC